MDTFAPATPADLLQLHMDPPHAVPGVGDGALLDVMPGEAIDALVAVSGPDTPLLSVELRHLGGAVGRAPEGHGALATLEGDFALFAVGIAPHADAAAAIKAHLDVVEGAICEWDAGRRYLNFTESAVDTRTRVLGARPTAACRRSRRWSTPTTSSGPTTRSRPSTEHTLGGNAQLSAAVPAQPVPPP